MKRKRFPVAQIAAIIRQAEMGIPVAELIRCVGFRQANVLSLGETICPIGTEPVVQFKQLQEQNGRLKKLAAELTLDRAMSQEVGLTTVLSPGIDY